MRGIIECRKLLGDRNDLSDKQVESVRDDLQFLAAAIVELFAASEKSPRPIIGPNGLQARLNHLDIESQYAAQERAAIMEIDGGLDRDLAERAAFARHVQPKKRGTP